MRSAASAAPPWARAGGGSQRRRATSPAPMRGSSGVQPRGGEAAGHGGRQRWAAPPEGATGARAWPSPRWRRVGQDQPAEARSDGDEGGEHFGRADPVDEPHHHGPLRRARPPTGRWPFSGPFCARATWHMKDSHGHRPPHRGGRLRVLYLQPCASFGGAERQASIVIPGCWRAGSRWCRWWGPAETMVRWLRRAGRRGGRAHRCFPRPVVEPRGPLDQVASLAGATCAAFGRWPARWTRSIRQRGIDLVLRGHAILLDRRHAGRPGATGVPGGLARRRDGDLRLHRARAAAPGPACTRPICCSAAARPCARRSPRWSPRRPRWWTTASSCTGSARSSADPARYRPPGRQAGGGIRRARGPREAARGLHRDGGAARARAIPR